MTPPEGGQDPDDKTAFTPLAEGMTGPESEIHCVDDPPLPIHAVINVQEGVRPVAHQQPQAAEPILRLAPPERVVRQPLPDVPKDGQVLLVHAQPLGPPCPLPQLSEDALGGDHPVSPAGTRGHVILPMASG